MPLHAHTAAAAAVVGTGAWSLLLVVKLVERRVENYGALCAALVGCRTEVQSALCSLDQGLMCVGGEGYTEQRGLETQGDAS